MHFTNENKAVQGENGPKSSDHNWASIKFRDDLELMYQFSLTAIKKTKICTKNLKCSSQFLYLSFCCVRQS